MTYMDYIAKYNNDWNLKGDCDRVAKQTKSKCEGMQQQTLNWSQWQTETMTFKKDSDNK